MRDDGVPETMPGVYKSELSRDQIADILEQFLNSREVLERTNRLQRRFDYIVRDCVDAGDFELALLVWAVIGCRAANLHSEAAGLVVSMLAAKSDAGILREIIARGGPKPVPLRPLGDLTVARLKALRSAQASLVNVDSSYHDRIAAAEALEVAFPGALEGHLYTAEAIVDEAVRGNPFAVEEVLGRIDFRMPDRAEPSTAAEIDLVCPRCGGDLVDLPNGMLGYLCTKCQGRINGGGQGPNDEIVKPKEVRDAN